MIANFNETWKEQSWRILKFPIGEYIPKMYKYLPSIRTKKEYVWIGNFAKAQGTLFPVYSLMDQRVVSVLYLSVMFLFLVVHRKASSYTWSQLCGSTSLIA